MSNTHSHLWPGVPLALCSAILFGASAPLSKLLIGSADPWPLAGILYLGAGIGLAVIHWGRRSVGLPNIEAPLQRADLPWLAAVVFFGGMLGLLFLMFGLSLNLEGLATMGIAWLVFRENVDRRLLLGAAAILAGAVLLSWNGAAFKLDTGGLFIAAACLACGIDNNQTRKLSADPVQIAMIKGLVAGITNLVLALWLGASLQRLGLTSADALVGFFGVGVSLVMFMLGFRHLETARTGAYFSLAAFIGAILSLLLFHEPMTFQLVAAGLLMATGLWLHFAERHDHGHGHEALEHEHSHSHEGHISMTMTGLWRVNIRTCIVTNSYDINPALSGFASSPFTQLNKSDFA